MTGTGSARAELAVNLSNLFNSKWGDPYHWSIAKWYVMKMFDLTDSPAKFEFWFYLTTLCYIWTGLTVFFGTFFYLKDALTKWNHERKMSQAFNNAHRNKLTGGGL